MENQKPMLQRTAETPPIRKSTADDRTVRIVGIVHARRHGHTSEIFRAFDLFSFGHFDEEGYQR